jgi:DNA excision repair protein ERCC-4
MTYGLEKQTEGSLEERQFAALTEEHRDLVAIDIREWGSRTPPYLHERGFWLVPIQLTVGDYILSDQICVERKSVVTGDLWTSINDGRLLQQVTNMERYYERPILLLEFDETVEFHLDTKID